MREVTFFGMLFTSQGMKPDPRKVAIIKNAKPPTSQATLNSFTCMVAWNDLFVERFAEIVRPLRDLAKQLGKFIWLPKHQKAFEEVKDKLSEHCLNIILGKTETLIYLPTPARTVTTLKTNLADFRRSWHKQMNKDASCPFILHPVPSARQRKNGLKSKSRVVQYGTGWTSSAFTLKASKN